MIFDCDGTLVDSEPLAGEAWRRTLTPYGYTLTDADLEAVTGTTFQHTHAYLAERVEIPRAEVLWPELRAELFALLRRPAEAVRRRRSGPRRAAGERHPGGRGFLVGA